jgi:nucleoside-diphosphate kinase
VFLIFKKELMKIMNKTALLFLVLQMISMSLAAEEQDTQLLNRSSIERKQSPKEQSTGQQTLCIIKPNVASNPETVQAINDMIVKSGLKIIDSKEVTLSFERAKEFYREHEGKDFFQELCAFMSSKKVIVQILEGENAVQVYRELMGPTNPAKDVDKKTIRGKFGDSIDKNSVHGSDKPESAAREIAFFFSTMKP